MVAKKDIPKNYPKGEKLLKWWDLFDEFEGEELRPAELVAIGAKRGMARGTGSAQYQRWRAYHKSITGTVKPSKLSKTATQKENEETQLSNAFKSEFEAEDIYLEVSQTMPNVADAAYRSWQRAKEHKRKVLISLNILDK